MIKDLTGIDLQVSLIHMKISDSSKKNLETAEKLVKKAAELDSQFIGLPEYFAFPANIEDKQNVQKIAEEIYEPTVEFLKRISKKIDSYIGGGTIFEKYRGKYYNTSFFLKKGKILGKFRKMHLTNWEKKVGLNVGKTFKIFETEYCKIGILICADVFYPKTVGKLASLGAEVIFLPVSASRTHPHVKGHPLTTKRAKNNMVFILKNGNTRSNSRGGNSAIISPWGVLSQAKDEIQTKIISANLDIKKLRNF
jgi:predicted amidohydrolase